MEWRLNYSELTSVSLIDEAYLLLLTLLRWFFVSYCPESCSNPYLQFLKVFQNGSLSQRYEAIGGALRHGLHPCGLCCRGAFSSTKCGECFSSFNRQIISEFQNRSFALVTLYPSHHPTKRQTRMATQGWLMETWMRLRRVDGLLATN